MEWRTLNGAVEFKLPITTPTGKVRVKRPRAGHAPEPVACRSKPMIAGDYLEWQISYDTPDRDNPSVVLEAELHKAAGLRFGCELVRLMVEVHRLGLLPAARWNELRTLLDAQIATDGIEERERIITTPPAADAVADAHGFRRFVQHVPDYLKTTPSYTVEIKIAPKQRAVGTQAMIYVHLPVQACSAEAGALPGRTAVQKEQVTYTITAANSTLVSDTVLAFVLASRSHAQDIKLIFDALGL